MSLEIAKKTLNDAEQFIAEEAVKKVIQNAVRTFPDPDTFANLVEASDNKILETVLPAFGGLGSETEIGMLRKYAKAIKSKQLGEK